MFSYAAGVPDAPEISISDGIAYWNPVNQRSSGSVNYHLTAMTPDMILVGEIDIPTGNVADMIMQDLSVGDLNLQVDVGYTICVTAENEIGESDPGCVESYVHMIPGNHTTMSCTCTIYVYGADHFHQIYTSAFIWYLRSLQQVIPVVPHNYKESCNKRPMYGYVTQS